MVRVRRITAVDGAGQPRVKDDDLFDEVEYTDDMMVSDVIARLFEVQSDLGEMANWTVRGMSGTAMVPIEMNATPASVFANLVMYRKGG